MSEALEWIQSNDTLLWWLFIVSVVTFVATLVAVPIAVSRIPRDHFKPTPDERRRIRWSWTPGRMLWHIVKNLFGVILILAGFAMLFIPGQGVITMLIGIMLLDFPGKYALERSIVRRPQVLRTINWMRARAGTQPLDLGDVPSSSRPR